MPEDKYAAIKENIRKAETALKELSEELRKAKLAGVDVSATEKQYSELSANVIRLKSVYGV
jgi:hypothetical protein